MITPIAFQAPDDAAPLLTPVSEANPLPVYFPGGLPSGGVPSVQGTAGNVLINGGTSVVTGAAVFTLPAALTGISSITSPVALTLDGTSLVLPSNKRMGSTNTALYLDNPVAGTLVLESSGSTYRLWGGLSGMGLVSGDLLQWSSSATNGGGAYDVALGRNAAGIAEINNGTPGTYRDLQLRNIIASGDVAAATYHVGADAGVDGTITGASTVTVKKGIITAIS